MHLHLQLHLHPRTESEEVDLGCQLRLPVLNCLWSLSVGERFTYSHPKLLSIVDRLDTFFRHINSPAEVPPTSHSLSLHCTLQNMVR